MSGDETYNNHTLHYLLEGAKKNYFDIRAICNRIIENCVCGYLSVRRPQITCTHAKMLLCYMSFVTYNTYNFVFSVLLTSAYGVLNLNQWFTVQCPI